DRLADLAADLASVNDLVHAVTDVPSHAFVPRLVSLEDPAKTAAFHTALLLCWGSRESKVRLLLRAGEPLLQAALAEPQRLGTEAACKRILVRVAVDVATTHAEPRRGLGHGQQPIRLLGLWSRPVDGLEQSIAG